MEAQGREEHLTVAGKSHQLGYRIISQCLSQATNPVTVRAIA
jgi:hypothetical protein